MSFTLVLNSANVYGTGNNTYKYDFLKGNFNIPEDSEVMVANVQIPYSFYNITSAYNNNQFKIYFPSGSSTYTPYTMTIPDGFYTTTSLNYLLQQFCIAYGLYLINSTGQNVYYLSFQYNSFQYGNQILATQVPYSLPSGYSVPTGDTSSPKIQVLGDGTGASASLTVTSGVITGYTITNQGSGYSSISLNIIGNTAGSGGVFTSFIGKSVASVSVSAGGTGYTNGTSIPVTFSPPTGLNGVTATGTVNVVGGVVTGFTLLNGGSGYLSPPTISLTPGSGATFNITLSSTGNLGYVQIVNGGSGYPSTDTLFGNNGFPIVPRSPYIEILNNNFGTFLGFSAGTYPNAGFTGSFSKNSDITPVGSYVNSIILRCSLVNNKVGNPMDILDSFTIGATSFGTNINYAPSVNKWVKLSAGTFSNFLVTFCDQNLNLIQALDNNILITLLFRFPSKKLLKNE